MTKVENIIAQVAALPDTGVDECLAAALPTAEPWVQQHLIDQLQQRNQHAGRIGIITYYHSLSPELQQQIQQHITDLTGELALLLADPRSAAADNALTLIADAQLVDLAYLLPNGLRSPQEQVRERAAQTLLSFATAVHEAMKQSQPPSATQMASLIQAVVQGLHSYEGHRQTMVLQSLLLLGTVAIATAGPLLSDDRHVLVNHLRRLMEQADEPWVRQALPVLMLIPTLTDSAMMGFKRARLSGKHVDVFTHPHLLHLPRLRGTLRSMTGVHDLLPDSTDYQRMTADQQLATVHWLERLPLDPPQRIEALSRLKNAPDAGARLAAVRALIEQAQPPFAESAHAALAGFHHDESAPVAVLTLRHLLRVRWPGLLRLLPAFINSPHPTVKRIATHFLSPLAFDRLWTAWYRLSEKQKLAAGAAQIKFDPHFHHRLGERLCARERSTRMRALAMIATLGQGAFFERPLLHLAGDGDAKVVASVVRGLGSTSLPPTPASPLVIAALEKCLEHNDSRVRANAVEALEQLGASGHLQRLLRMAQKEAPRPRANAIRALLRLHHSQAGELLTTMLADPHANQRISALWVVQALGYALAAATVADLSLIDPDPQVRKRAEQVTQQLLGRSETKLSSVPTQTNRTPAGPMGLVTLLVMVVTVMMQTVTHAQLPLSPGEEGDPLGGWSAGVSVENHSFFQRLSALWPSPASVTTVTSATLSQGERDLAEAPNQRWHWLAENWPEDLRSDYFNLPWSGLVLVGLVVALMVGLKLGKHWWGGRDNSSPTLAFWSLAGGLGLTIAERRLLWRIARYQRLPSALTLLLSPATLAHHGRAYAQSTTRPQRIDHQLQQVSRKLFA